MIKKIFVFKFHKFGSILYKNCPKVSPQLVNEGEKRLKKLASHRLLVSLLQNEKQTNQKQKKNPKKQRTKTKTKAKQNIRQKKTKQKWSKTKHPPKKTK